MTSEKEHAELLERNRRMIASLNALAPDGFDPKEKLVFVENPDFNRTGFMVGQRSLDYAFILLKSGGNADLASDIIDKTLHYQDLRDPDSPTYGNFFWFTNWTEVRDANAVSFMAPHYVRIWRRHRDKLRADTARALEERFPLILNGLMRQPSCRWAYTNIFLLTTAGRLMVSQLTGDNAALKETIGHWDEWIDKTSRFGIPEFNSPTYTPVDIFALMLVREAAPGEDFQKHAERALDYFFLEFFLHYHPEIGLLTGAYSRAYLNEAHTDLRLGAGVDIICHHQLGTPLDLPQPGVLSVAYSDYLAPGWMRELAREKSYPLTIEATSRREKGFWVRTNFMLHNYAVGSFSNSFYTILQAPVLVAYDAPTERKTVFTRSSPELGTCYADQIDDSVLAAFCYNFLDDRHRYGLVGPETREANLCLNLGAASDITEVLIAGEPWDGRITALGDGTSIVFRAGPIAVGVIPVLGHTSIEGDDLGSEEKPVVLVSDDEGVKLELLVYRGDQPAETASPRHQAGFYLRVTECDDLKVFAAGISEVIVNDCFDEDAWHLSAADGERELAVRAPLSAEPIFADGPKVGKNQPEPGWLLRSPLAELKVGEFAEIARGKQTWRRTPRE